MVLPLMVVPETTVAEADVEVTIVAGRFTTDNLDFVTALFFLPFASELRAFRAGLPLVLPTGLPAYSSPSCPSLSSSPSSFSLFLLLFPVDLLCTLRALFSASSSLAFKPGLLVVPFCLAEDLLF